MQTILQNMQPRRFKQRLVMCLPIALSLGILAFLIYPNLDALAAILKTIHPGFFLLAMACALTSYFFMGLSLWEVLKILGHRLPLWHTVGVAMVSTSVNYFVSSGGVSGFATRAHLLSRRGIPYGISVTSSVVISVFIYLVLSIIIIEGMLLQAVRANQAGIPLFEGVAGVLAVLAFAFLLVLLFFHHELRSAWARRLYHAVNRLLFFFSRKEIPQETFDAFECQLTDGIRTIHSRKYELPRVLGFVCMDWIFNIFALNYALRAVGKNLGSIKLVIGFAFGQLTTVIPVLPGGLGAMEAVMTAAYSKMGVPVGTALAASLIFRLIYYMLPALLSVLAYMALCSSEKSCGLGIGRTE